LFLLFKNYARYLQFFRKNQKNGIFKPVSAFNSLELHEFSGSGGNQFVKISVVCGK